MIPTTIWLFVVLLSVVLFILSMMLKMHNSSMECIIIARIFIGRRSMLGRCFLERDLLGNCIQNLVRRPSLIMKIYTSQLDLPVRFRFSCILLARCCCIALCSRTNADDAMKSIEIKLQNSVVFILQTASNTR